MDLLVYNRRVLAWKLRTTRLRGLLYFRAIFGAIFGAGTTDLVVGVLWESMIPFLPISNLISLAFF